MKFDILPKTNEEQISVIYGCVRFFESYRFLSSNSDSLVKTLVGNSHQSLKTLKSEIVGDANIVSIINEVVTMVSEDKTLKNLKKYFPDEIEKIEVLKIYLAENDLKFLKREFPDIWKYLSRKLAYSYEYLSGIDHYQKPVNNLEKKDFFCKLKNACPCHEEIERTNEYFNFFDIQREKN